MLMVFFVPLAMNAQNTITLNGNLTQTIAPNTSYTFYDSGGPSGAYSNGETYTATFNCTGNITINFSAIHKTNGNSTIIGFDNISITPTEEDGFLLGDTNCDGVVDISDVVLAVNHVLGSGAVKSETNTDTNQDESIDISDIVAIVNIILGM